MLLQVFVSFFAIQNTHRSPSRHIYRCPFKDKRGRKEGSGGKERKGGESGGGDGDGDGDGKGDRKGYIVDLFLPGWYRGIGCSCVSRYITKINDYLNKEEEEERQSEIRRWEGGGKGEKPRGPWVGGRREVGREEEERA